MVFIEAGEAALPLTLMMSFFAQSLGKVKMVVSHDF